MANSRSGNVQSSNANPSGDTGPAGERLNCQWCFKQLEPGVTICPTCGSPGVPDESLTMPAGGESDELSKLEVTEKSPEEIAAVMEEEGGSVYRNSSANAPDPAVTFLAVGGAVLISVVMGVIAAPLLETPFENTLGVVVDNPADLRPLGGVIGMLVGMFLGAIAMWVTNPRN